MSGLSDYAKKRMLNHLLGSGQRPLVSPEALYAGIVIEEADGAKTGESIVEPASGNYSRKRISFDEATPVEAKGIGKYLWSNAGPAEWRISGVVVLDATNGGNLISYENYVKPVIIKQHEVFSLDEIAIGFDGSAE